ncbi:c-type cytochrome [Xylophilus sp.]|uniref:c-type cytochrome n=1 Tax=Xylophilus sp. TaxID=2653893 RepID=UPI0013B6EC27|nr:cytochrome c [Xylophilus sp.]KAF1046511.1 MAG: Alcohol dehydrogenase (quinone), cytochrome c subunit [Xylophilus sp.]
MRITLVLAAVCVLLLAVPLARDLLGGGELPAVPAPATADAAQAARGAYLARVGNCDSCHTVPGGAPFAGGRAIETPFGAVHASNLTPHATGLAGWSADAFWRALHEGRSRDGRLLYPAFPYTSYTHVTREDSDALFAYFQSLPPADQPRRPHALRFPFDTQLALAAWRALFFRPGSGAPEPADAARPAEWRRGAYLVRGLGHCSACHTARNALGASSERLALSGGLIPVQNWYAPALNDEAEAGVAHWRLEEVEALLRTGVAPRGLAVGPMAEVVFRSTQYLDDGDLRAMATFLRALPQQPAPAPRAFDPAPPAVLQRGAALYTRHCADCHGAQGQGTPGAFPPLAGNRAVTMTQPANVLRMILQGGYAPATAGNPRPHGMPPFTQVLGDEDVAAVASYIRSAWGHRAAPVGALDVARARERRGS